MSELKYKNTDQPDKRRLKNKHTQRKSLSSAWRVFLLFFVRHVSPLVGLILEVPLVSPLVLATSLHALDTSRSLREN